MPFSIGHSALVQAFLPGFLLLGLGERGGHRQRRQAEEISWGKNARGIRRGRFERAVQLPRIVGKPNTGTMYITYQLLYFDAKRDKKNVTFSRVVRTILSHHDNKERTKFQNGL